MHYNKLDYNMQDTEDYNMTNNYESLNDLRSLIEQHMI